MSDTELLDWMGRYGFGCHHDARTQRWVSMAGCRFVSPRAALTAAVERVRAFKCPERAPVLAFESSRSSPTPKADA